MPNQSRHFLTMTLASLLCLAPTTALKAQETAEAKKCIDAGKISGYRIVTDEVIRLEMQGQKDVLLRLKRHCPQLHYHKYMSFTPVNGQLCARFDDIITRSGTPCRIESISEVSDESADTSP
ncbi:DUF6491 family protein [Kordiimonas lacus]|uniref:Uncharacterized protein n=1 Tax=Kordiimonas lacus TaxID=637679 RepID=A0A1G6TTJ7_9PROT|nr:DUF6491 family protein [Kordiimonas lacus]SDD31655.1 hypothetical protein SAMN04488071_0329 [Kordiimonas lacus]